MSIVGLERALLQYTSDPSMAANQFDLKSVPIDMSPMKEVPKQSELMASSSINLYVLSIMTCKVYHYPMPLLVYVPLQSLKLKPIS